MCFVFTCGDHMFSSLLQGYEDVTVQCQNCGNFSAKLYKRWQWFTVCFVPLIPFSVKPDHDVGCHICNFFQDVKHRPDVQSIMENSQAQGQIPLQPQGNPPQQNKASKVPAQYI